MGKSRKIKAEHGIVVARPHERFGYFAWPSVARMDDGTLVVACSGRRSHHVDPWGKTVLCTSGDDGATWSEPQIINDTPLDDRDAGVVNLGGDRLLVTWFTSDTRVSLENCRQTHGDEEYRQWRAVLGLWTDEMVAAWLGSWIRLSEDGGATWSEAVRAPASTPHGPIVLADGDLLYFGKQCDTRGPHGRDRPIVAARSTDGGRTWTVTGAVPACKGAHNDNLHEPHAVELPSRKLVGLIRYQHQGEHKAFTYFSLFQTESEDGGATWSEARPLEVPGSPPHVIRHSSGALVCVYGYRLKPYGQRVMISRDEGRTWEHDLVLRDDGPDSDLGYPASVELPDGTIFTVYYQKCAPGEKCSILWSRWELP